MSEDLKTQLEEVQEKVRKAREDQIQKKAERDGLQKQYDELVKQANDEFGLKPEELENHAISLEKEAQELLDEVNKILVS